MAAYVNNIVDSAHYPEIALLITPGAVAREVNSVDLRPILLFVALVVAPDGPEDRGPRPLDDEVTTLACAHGVAVARYYVGVDTGERLGCRAGLGGCGAGNRSDHDRASLSLPPRVNDRALVFANDLAIPHPRLGIDRFTDGAEQSPAPEGGLPGPGPPP